MIPLKLQLKNFLSYGPEVQTIDFSSYHLICLSGKNGHGKSALLDAITWALWGQARKSSISTKPDASLLHLGQTFMMVSFDFEFNQQNYRIKREFGKTYGKPYAQLEFGLLNPETNSVIPLTDKTIKKTQQKIEETLRLDFNSFVNSAFLRQGSANEFSQKNPKERKEVLASILGLNHYEELKKRAQDKIKQANTTKTAHQTIVEKITIELAAQSTLEEQGNEVQKKLEEISQKEIELEQKHIILAQQETAILANQKESELLSYKLQQQMNEQLQREKELRATFNEWRSVHSKKIQIPSITILDNQHTKLTSSLKEHQNKLQNILITKEQILKTKEELHTLAQKIQEQFNNSLQEKRINIERAKAELENTKNKENELKTTLNSLQTELASLTQEQNKYSSILAQQASHEKQLIIQEQQFDKRKALYQKLAAQGNIITAELQALQQKELLVQNDQDPSCPLCEQNLSSSRKRFLKSKFGQNQQAIHHQLTRIKKVVTSLKSILITQNEQLKLLQKNGEQFSNAALQLEEVHKSILKKSAEVQKTIAYSNNLASIVQQLEKQLHILSTELIHLDTTKTSVLQTNAEYQALANKLLSFELEIKALNYDPQKHLEIEEQLQLIEKQRANVLTLQQQIQGQNLREATIQELCIKLKNIRFEQQILSKSLLSFATLASREKELSRLGNDLKEQSKQLNAHKELLLQEKGKIEAQQQKLIQLKCELTLEQERIALLNNDINDYYAIAAATGKDGIQALLIEEAIPEIEQEANFLLAKLTNNQSQIFLESLRDLKGGGTKETLDINISDPAGIRAYEMFSGGEAFRIDFALRIAISKLLARRAGTALQTLIIDEGFGSQDEEGLGYIMDALYKIQDDFAKIIIVSHLPSMKEQFPVHFVIEKKPQGSIVKVVEQG